MADGLVHLVITGRAGAGSRRRLLCDLLPVCRLILQRGIDRRFVDQLTRHATVNRRIGDLFRELLTAHNRLGRINLTGALNACEVHIGIHLRAHRTRAQDRLEDHHNAIAVILLELLGQTIMIFRRPHGVVFALVGEQLTGLVDH